MQISIPFQKSACFLAETFFYFRYYANKCEGKAPLQLNIWCVSIQNILLLLYFSYTLLFVFSLHIVYVLILHCYCTSHYLLAECWCAKQMLCSQLLLRAVFFFFFFAVVSIAAAAADYYVKFQLFPIAQNAQRAYKRRCDYAAFGSGVTSYRKRWSLKMKISRKIIWRDFGNEFFWLHSKWALHVNKNFSLLV